VKAGEGGRGGRGLMDNGVDGGGGRWSFLGLGQGDGCGGWPSVTWFTRGCSMQAPCTSGSNAGLRGGATRGGRQMNPRVNELVWVERLFGPARWNGGNNDKDMRMRCWERYFWC
jgi:hypothetical protein